MLLLTVAQETKLSSVYFFILIEVTTLSHVSLKTLKEKKRHINNLTVSNMRHIRLIKINKFNIGYNVVYVDSFSCRH